MKALAVAFVVLLLTGGPALADGGRVEPETSGFIASWTETVLDQVEQSSTSADPIVQTLQVPACAVGGDQVCGELYQCDDGSTMVLTSYVTESGAVLPGGDSCPVSAAPQPEVTPGLVATAFRRLPLPASRLIVQPPGGRTLVNFDTNFYTERDELTRVVTLLGRRVELRIWPARFGWSFGDGEESWTTSPGDKYPNLEVTHRYLSKGRVSPSVATTYAAQFRVGNGPWRDVAGTVTIPGTPQSLQVVTARPVLVGSG